MKYDAAISPGFPVDGLQFAALQTAKFCGYFPEMPPVNRKL